MSQITVKSETLKAFCTEAFRALNVPAPDAEIAASNLVEAELRGLASHGVMRLEAYLSKLAQGGFNPTPDIQVVKDGPSMAVIDGNDGLGAVIGTRAMSLCLEKARTSGIACTTVWRGNHFGISAQYDCNFKVFVKFSCLMIVCCTALMGVPVHTSGFLVVNLHSVYT